MLTTLFYMSFCGHLRAQLEDQRSYKNALPNKQQFYYWRSLFSGLEMYMRYDRWVMDLNMHHTLFMIQHLCVLTLFTQKLQVVHGCCTYRMTALLSKMSIFCIRAWSRYDWRVMVPNPHHSLFPISHLCVLIHITWKLQVTRIYGRSVYQTTALLLDTFLVWFRVA